MAGVAGAGARPSPSTCRPGPRRAAAGRRDDHRFPQQPLRLRLTWFGFALHHRRSCWPVWVWRQLRPKACRPRPDLLAPAAHFTRLRQLSTGHPLMQFVSTRGEAPALGFSDAVLSGLATDGGLYLPETLAADLRPPRSPASPASPMPMSPSRSFALRRRRDPGRPSSSAIIDEAYATFRHPSVTPLVELAPGHFVLELFHGPTLAFKDVAMQFLARVMDHILAERGSPRHHRRRHLGRHRLGRHRGLPRPRHHRHLHPPSRGPHLRGAAPADDDGARRQRPQHRAAGHVRRLPGDRERPVRQPRLPRRDAAQRRQLDQLGPHRRADRLLLHRRGLARRAASRR